MKPVLRLSILLNVALALAAVLVLLWRQADVAPTGSPETTLAHVVSEAPPGQANPIVSTITNEVTITNAFHWQTLESTNYDTFVANLRTIDCPDRTIRDLIFADAERRYADLESVQSETIPFWLAGRALVEATRRNETNRTVAQAELRAQLRRLFGVDWSPEEGEANDLKFQAFSHLLAGPVTDDQHEYAWRWVLATVEQSRLFKQERRILLTSDNAEWEKRAKARVTELEAVFSKPVFEEFQARTALLEELMMNRMIHLEDLDLSPTELRRACLIKVREVGWLEELMQVDRNSSEATKETQKVAFAAALQRELSPASFEEFVRVQDEDYRDILSVTRDNNLPRDSAQKIYGMRQLAKAESQRLQTDGSDEAAVALLELQQTTADSIRKVLGADAFNKFTARNGQWVTNFTKL